VRERGIERASQRDTKREIARDRERGKRETERYRQIRREKERDIDIERDRERETCTKNALCKMTNCCLTKFFCISEKFMDN
jgi:hypothetical protein